MVKRKSKYIALSSINDVLKAVVKDYAVALEYLKDK
jgi:hypothetical protein